MLQIIGWLLCVYLVVKGCELLAMNRTAAYIGAAIAFVAAPVFFVLLNKQVTASNAPFNQLGAASSQYDPKTKAQVDADVAAAEAAVDNALEAASRAVENADAAILEAQQ